MPVGNISTSNKRVVSFGDTLFQVRGFRTHQGNDYAICKRMNNTTSQEAARQEPDALVRLATNSELPEIINASWGDRYQKAHPEKAASFIDRYNNFSIADTIIQEGYSEKGAVISLSDTVSRDPIDNIKTYAGTRSFSLITPEKIQSGTRAVYVGPTKIEGQDGDKPWRRIRVVNSSLGKLISTPSELSDNLVHLIRTGHEPFIRIIETEPEPFRQGLLLSSLQKDERNRPVLDEQGGRVYLEPVDAVDRALLSQKAVLDRVFMSKNAQIEVIPTIEFMVAQRTAAEAPKRKSLRIELYNKKDGNLTGGNTLGMYDGLQGFRQSYVLTHKLSDGTPIAIDARPVGTGHKVYSILDIVTPTFNPYQRQTSRQRPNRSQEVTRQTDHKSTGPQTDPSGRPVPVTDKAPTSKDPDHVQGEKLDDALKRIEQTLSIDTAM